MRRRKRSAFVIAVSIGTFLNPSLAAACGWRNPGRCLNKPAETIVVATTPSVLVDVARGERPGTTAGEAVSAGAGAIRHGGAEARRAVGNVAEAGLAIGRYVEDYLNGYRNTLTDAQRRFRDGRLIDGFWHAAVDPLRHQEAAAARAVQTSSLLNTVAATAASVYGGPGGAAAYASWYTYRATGDVELAIRVGILAGATRYGTGAASSIPNVAQRSIVTGAIGGIAVAAAGGDQEALVNGFLMSGGMVLVQAGFESEVGQPMDARAAEGRPYCMATVGAECSPPDSAYVRDANGHIQYQENGMPMVDVRRTELRRPHVGTWARAGEAGVGQETGLPMRMVAQVPGMNTMSVFHDHWSFSWNMDAFTNKASIVPAVVLTYVGTGGAADNHLLNVAVENRRRARVSAGLSAASESEASRLVAAHLLDALRLTGGIDAGVEAGTIRPVQIWMELDRAHQTAVRSVRYEFNHPSFRSPKHGANHSELFRARWRGYGCIHDAAVVATLQNGSSIRAPFSLCDLWTNGIIDEQ